MRGDRYGGPQVPVHDRRNDPPAPGRDCQYTSEQLARHLESYGTRPSAGRTGVCWAGAWAEVGGCDPEEREGLSDGVSHKKQGHPGYCPLRSSPVHTIRNDSTPPWGTGRRARSTRSTEQQDKQPERPLSELSEIRPAAQVEQTRIGRELGGIQQRQEALGQELAATQTVVRQALDLAQHMAAAYRQAPDHIRRLLNQALFAHIELVPDPEAGLLASTARCRPPFDDLLGQTASQHEAVVRQDGGSRQGGTAAVSRASQATEDGVSAGGHEAAWASGKAGTMPGGDFVTPSQALPELAEDEVDGQKMSKNMQQPQSGVTRLGV